MYVSDIVKMTSDLNETIDVSVDILTDDDDDSLPDIKLGKIFFSYFIFIVEKKTEKLFKFI